MVVGFTTTCAISAYHHLNCGFESQSWRGVLDTTLCDKVCQWLVTGRWFSLGTPVSSTNKTDCHDISEILLKVTLNTINLTLTQLFPRFRFAFYNYLVTSANYCLWLIIILKYNIQLNESLIISEHFQFQQIGHSFWNTNSPVDYALLMYL